MVALGEFTGNMRVGDPNAMMSLMFYIDDKADEDHRHALRQIFTGYEGGWPGEFGSLIKDLRGIEYAPICSCKYRGSSSKHFPFDWRPEA